MNKWDSYFYKMAHVVKENSSCLSRKIGAVLVRDKSVIGTGYNGPPRGVPSCGVRHKFDENLLNEYKKQTNICADKNVILYKCPRQILNFKSGEGLQWCVAGHAERNALINCARLGISTINTTLYLTCGIPCTPCLIEIINAGVKEIVVTSYDYYDYESSKYLINNSDIIIRLYE